jgi:hypothetical protein
MTLKEWQQKTKIEPQFRNGRATVHLGPMHPFLQHLYVLEDYRVERSCSRENCKIAFLLEPKA